MKIQSFLENLSLSLSLSQIIILLIFFIIIHYGISLTHVPPTISLSCVSLYLFLSFTTSLWVMDKSYWLPLCLMGFIPSLVHHLWASMCQPCTSFIHENLASHHCLTPLTILYCWASSKIVCVGFMSLACCNISSPL